MTDPYNSYQSYVPATAPAASPASPPPPVQIDRISRLDVSEAWKEIFWKIQDAGGAELPRFRDLSFSERWRIQQNWLAFFFGPIYYLIKGLWRQAIVYVVLAVTIGAIVEAMGWGRAVRSVGIGFSVIYSMRANVSYYRRVVLGDAPWF